jgi:hypothetical protein
MTPKAQSTKEKIEKWLYQTEKLFTAKETVNKMKK